jgi:hypothetical protein
MPSGRPVESTAVEIHAQRRGCIDTSCAGAKRFEWICCIASPNFGYSSAAVGLASV